MLWLALLSCTVPEPEIETASAHEDWLVAWCRLYVDERCVQKMNEQCAWNREPLSIDECRDFVTFELSQCEGIDAAFAESDDVAGCVAQFQAFDCETDQFCDEDLNPTFDQGACIPVNDMIEDSCGEPLL